MVMLDVDFSTLKAEMAGYLPIALLIGVVLVMQLAMAFGIWSYADTAVGAREVLVNPEYHNTQALGLILYDRYFILFQLPWLVVCCTTNKVMFGLYLYRSLLPHSHLLVLQWLFGKHVIILRFKCHLCDANVR